MLLFTGLVSDLSPYKYNLTLSNMFKAGVLAKRPETDKVSFCLCSKNNGHCNKK